MPIGSFEFLTGSSSLTWPTGILFTYITKAIPFPTFSILAKQTTKLETCKSYWSWQGSAERGHEAGSGILATSEKCIYYGGRNCKCSYRFIIRDIAQVGQRSERCLPWWPKDEGADETQEGPGMQDRKNQTLIIFPSPMLWLLMDFRSSWAV